MLLISSPPPADVYAAKDCTAVVLSESEKGFISTRCHLLKTLAV
jgi:hypothetical protein